MTNIQESFKYILKSYSTKCEGGVENVEYVIIQLVDGYDSFEYKVQEQEFDVLRMLPLCWIEGKPVYKGDVLWRVDNSTGNLQKFVVESIERYSKYSCNYLVSEDNLHIGLDFIYSTLHWDKPKVKVQKVQKEGWMNIYPSVEYSTFPCENSAIYRTKEIADDCANSNRIDCVKVQWEVEE